MKLKLEFPHTNFKYLKTDPKISYPKTVIYHDVFICNYNQSPLYKPLYNKKKIID